VPLLDCGYEGHALLVEVAVLVVVVLQVVCFMWVWKTQHATEKE
jgi:hypothetical protein